MFRFTALSFKNLGHKLSTSTLFFASLTVFAMPMAHAINTAEAEAARQNIVNRIHHSHSFCDKNNDIKKSANKTSTLQNQNQQLIDCLLNELQTYQSPKRTARQRYFSYKAQAWLNYASHEKNIESETNAAPFALQTASAIIAALRQDQEQQLPLITDIPPMSGLMRPDLWATLSALKDSQGIDVAPRELAFSEVTLIWAAADQCKHSEQQAGTLFRMSERWLEQAREAYINAHTSQENVLLGERINQYYKQYASLDTGNDQCNGQKLPISTLSNAQKNTTINFSNNDTLNIAARDITHTKTAHGQILDNNFINTDYVQVTVSRIILPRNEANASSTTLPETAP